jgi:hypothetical protein
MCPGLRAFRTPG